MILEEFNLNMTKITFKMNNSHHLYSLTIIQFCNVTDSILTQLLLGLALEKTSMLQPKAAITHITNVHTFIHKNDFTESITTTNENK